MATFNEQLFDAMVRHQIGVLRFSGSVRNRIWALLDETEADLKDQIRRTAARAGFDTPARLTALNVMLGKLRETRIRSWKRVRAVWFDEMHGLARSEPGFVDKLFVATFPVELATVLPDAAVLRNLVTATPYYGKTLRQWADDIQQKDLDRIASAVRIGVVQGEHPNRIARRIVGTVGLRGRDGVTQITRRGAATITRTVAAGIAAQGKDAYLRANADLAPKKLFTATLDSRTTPICRRFDGQLFAVDDPRAPVLPLHMGERSTYSPVVDGKVIGERPMRNFTQRSILREYAAETGISPVAVRARLPRGHKGAFDVFARRRMRELTGTTPAKTTYNQWLKRQPAAIQDDILGPARGALFRRGGLTVESFVEFNGRELTLSELAARHEEAFLLANLDPIAFAA